MLAAAIGRYRREFVGLLMATLAIFAIVTNALFMQKGPHPAPIFATRPLLQRDAGPAPRLQAVQSTPVVDLANQARIQLIGNIQRELSRKGFYDGPADGIWGAKTDAAVRDFVSATGLKINPEANDGRAPRHCCVQSQASERPRGASPGVRSDRETHCAIQKGDSGSAGARRFRLWTDKADRSFRSGHPRCHRKIRTRSSNACDGTDFRPLRAGTRRHDRSPAGVNGGAVIARATEADAIEIGHLGRGLSSPM